MISSLVFCSAVAAGEIPLSNGYLLFSALSKTLLNSGGVNFFHEEVAQGRKAFSLSALMPANFWLKFSCASVNGSLCFSSGDAFAFRISFLDDELFTAFFNSIIEQRIKVGNALFDVFSVSLPGDNEMSIAFSPEFLRTLPPCSGAEIHFISPVGFRSSGIQKMLPIPELLFGSLAEQWSLAFGESLLSEIPHDVLVGQFSLRSCAVLLKNRSVSRGCIGKISFDWRKKKKETRQALSCLVSFSFFCGVGYKTTQGLGQTLPRLIE